MNDDIPKHYTPPRLSDAELLKVFPEAERIFPKLIRELWCKKDTLLERIIEQEASINAESSDDVYRYFWKSWYVEPLRDDVKQIDQKLTRLVRQLRLIKGVAVPTNAINNEQIQEAKQVPIETLFDQQFRRTGDKLVGFCPFSEERTPSFFIYTKSNRCWCFGCQQGGNPIDTLMKLHDCTLKEAVLELLGGNK